MINQTFVVENLKSKSLYWCLILGDPFTPSCVQRWSKSNIELSKSEWGDIFSKTNTISSNVRYQMFYYKVIHKNYASDSIVAKFDPTVNANCVYCNIICEIVHTFVTCVIVQPFWELFESWFNQNFPLRNNFVLTNRMKLLGLVATDRIENELEIDFILLHAKLYILICRKKGWRVSFIFFLRYLKHEMLIEKLCHKLSFQKQAAMDEIESIL